MDTKQIALKVVLDQIEESDEISSVNDRLRIQKAIYLAQAAGVSLGYHYSWYVKGPYSTDLTQDYYTLSEALKAGDESHLGRTLNPTLSARVPRIKEILSVPAEVKLPNYSWYEALASLHFLINTSKKSVEQAKEYMASVKPHLTSVVDDAVDHLRRHGLLS